MPGPENNTVEENQVNPTAEGNAQTVNTPTEGSDSLEHVLVINFGKEYIHKILPILNKIRNDRNVSIYPDPVKLSKQFTYADKNKFNYVIIFGQEEMKKEIFKIKNLNSGKECINSIKSHAKDFKF